LAANFDVANPLVNTFRNQVYDTLEKWGEVVLTKLADKEDKLIVSKILKTLVIKMLALRVRRLKT
jgi:hypothetical protein